MKVILTFRDFPHLEVAINAESEESMLKIIEVVLKVVAELERGKRR